MDFTGLDRYLRNLTEGTLPGVGCVVTQGQETVYQGYYGYADLASGRKMDAGTVCRVFSMTKVPVYTLCMMLWERGCFSLEDPLSRFFPEYAAGRVFVRGQDGETVTAPSEETARVRHILTMTLGIPYGSRPGSGDPSDAAMYALHQSLLAQKGYYTLREEIAGAAAVPMAFTPGQHWLYGFSSELTAGLVEAITGKEIGQAVRDELLTPLGMTSTGMVFFDGIRERFGTLYFTEPGKEPVPVDIESDGKHLPGTENLRGCPRLFSTAEDFSRLGILLANGGVYKGRRLIGADTIDLMRRNHLGGEALEDFRRSFQPGYGYGFGVRTLTDHSAGAKSSVGEFGWEGGCGPYFLADPEKSLSMTLMYQCLGSDLDGIHNTCRDLLYAGL